MRLRRSIIVALSSGLLLLGSTAAFADEGGCGEGGTGGGGGGGTVAKVSGSGTYHAAGPGSFSDVAITLAASDTTQASASTVTELLRSTNSRQIMGPLICRVPRSASM